MQGQGVEVAERRIYATGTSAMRVRCSEIGPLLNDKRWKFGINVAIREF